MGTSPLRFIVGLGNPGPEHAFTRHNAGFWFVDALARAHGGQFREQKRYQGELARIGIAGEDLDLFKPMTWMNRSGIAVRSLIDYFQVPAQQVLVAHDELDLPLGTVRLKLGGGAGGHNGLKDNMTHIGPEFWGMRVGMGHAGERCQVFDYVLRLEWDAEEDVMIRCYGRGSE